MPARFHALEHGQAGQDQDDEPKLTRPRTRADCIDGQRPCPWYSCPHHLALVRVLKTGEVRLQSRSVEAMPESCALDVADDGPRSVVEIAELLGVAPKNVHAVLGRAVGKMRKRWGRD